MDSILSDRVYNAQVQFPESISHILKESNIKPNLIILQIEEGKVAEREANLVEDIGGLLLF